MEAIVIGGVHHNILGVIRSLGKKGVEVRAILVKEKGDFVSKSKYIKKDSIKYIDAECEIFDTLLTLRLNHKQVIICCSDGAASQIDSHYYQLCDYFYLPNAAHTQGRINYLMNKSVQMEFAKDSGFLVPKTYIFNKSSNDYLVNWSEFPCIVKPVVSINGSKNDILICKNKKELTGALESSSLNRCQIQQFLSKEFEYQLIGCSINGGESVIIPGYTRIIRQPLSTNTGYLSYNTIDEVVDQKIIDKSIVFVRKIEYSGLFSLEFIRDKEGNDLFLEINLRNDGNAYCVTKSGVNLPYIWLSSFDTGNVLREDTLVAKRHIIMMPEFADIVNVYTKTVSLRRWLYEFVTADCHTILNCKDMKPFIYFFNYKFFGMFRNRISRFFL